MMAHHFVRYGGRSIEDAAPGIRVLDIREGEAKAEGKSVPRGSVDGSVLLGTYRQQLTVEILLKINEKDYERRMQAMERLARHVREPGYLETKYRAGQRLYVERAEIKGFGSVRDWTDTVTLECTAYAKPFWESVRPVIATAQNGGSCTLQAPGTGNASVVEAQATCTSGTVNRLTLTVDRTQMTFEGLGLAEGRTLTVGHEDNGLLYIRIGERSVMAKRTIESDDELLAKPGRRVTASVEADGGCTAVFRTRGRWL